MSEFSWKHKPGRAFIKATSAFLLATMIFTSSGAASICEAAENQPATVSEINFQGAQLGFVLGGISKAFNVNFSVSSAAAMKVVSLHFKTQTTLDDLLDMLRSTAAVSIEEYKPHSYIVRTIEETKGDTQGMSEKEKEIYDAEKRISNGVTRTFILNYVKASDVATAINKVLGENAKNVCSVSVLGGEASDDDQESGIKENEMREYSTIIVYAVNENIMKHIEELVAAIDQPKPLVEVEAVFVEVSSNDSRDLGFDWEVLPNPIEFVESAVGTTTVDATDAVPIFRKSTVGQIRRTSALSTSISTNLNESNSRGRVLSNPRIRVMSGHIAGFSSETQVPILNKDSDGEVTTEYKDVGITLDILPVVLENDQIYLTVKPSVAAITDTVTLGDTQAPQISERSAETTLLMRDGETMVIGGLLSDRDIKTMNRVPILWKIPLLGELFKSEGTTKEHSSISVYIRLKLIKDYMGQERTPVNIPNVKVDQLLNGLTDEQVAAAAKQQAGEFKVNENVQGVLPVPMGDQRVEITPIQNDAEETTATPTVTTATDNSSPQAQTQTTTTAQNWRERYDQMVADMLARDGMTMADFAPSTQQTATGTATVGQPETQTSVPVVRTTTSDSATTPTYSSPSVNMNDYLY